MLYILWSILGIAVFLVILVWLLPLIGTLFFLALIMGLIIFVTVVVYVLLYNWRHQDRGSGPDLDDSPDFDLHYTRSGHKKAKNVKIKILNRGKKDDGD